MTNIGTRIKELRQEKKMSISELSKLSGLSIVSISNYENGIHEPGYTSVFKLATALKCNYNELCSLLKKEKE